MNCQEYTVAQWLQTWYDLYAKQNIRESTQIIKLPPGVYTLDHLPILLNWVDIVVVGVSAMTLCFLATIYPARQASSLEPAEALRFE